MDWPTPGKWSVEGKASRTLGGRLESSVTNRQMAKVLCKHSGLLQGWGGEYLFAIISPIIHQLDPHLKIISDPAASSPPFSSLQIFGNKTKSCGNPPELRIE